MDAFPLTARGAAAAHLSCLYPDDAQGISTRHLMNLHGIADDIKSTHRNAQLMPNMTLGMRLMLMRLRLVCMLVLGLGMRLRWTHVSN